MANLAPGQDPGGGSLREGGAPEADPQNKQYGSSLFGFGGNWADSGAPGSPGASGAADTVNQPGQLSEGISGSGPDVTADSGAPGSQGAQNNAGGPDRVTYTEPGSFLSGTNTQATVDDSVSGTNDWTQATDGSYGGSLNLPSIAGNQPDPNGGPYQPGSGRVRRGGFMNGQR